MNPPTFQAKRRPLPLPLPPSSHPLGHHRSATTNSSAQSPSHSAQTLNASSVTLFASPRIRDHYRRRLQPFQLTIIIVLSSSPAPYSISFIAADPWPLLQHPISLKSGYVAAPKTRTKPNQIFFCGGRKHYRKIHSIAGKTSVLVVQHLILSYFGMVLATAQRTRSIRRRPKFQRRVEDNQMCAFDLLATLAGKLLQEKGSPTLSSDTSSQKDQSGFDKECQNANK
ncbi:hypothetical protein RIF29_10250 [Crotalaria pallida]|uniref:Uncharacterized protein n=1 Tax=Crotalaria pallida TaxID=3830 RepID=A0AAN9FYU8_CROPI